MGKSSPEAPAPPDPAATAKAQSAADKETAIANAALNRINQITPYGQLSYQQTGFDDTAQVPLYTQTTTFSPEQQELYDISQQFNVNSGNVANEQLNRLSTALSKPVSYDDAPALMAGADEATRTAAENALMSRMEPQFERDRNALESRLASQGISMGSDAYNQSMDEINRAKTDARQQAALEAIGLGQSQSQMQNQARQQYVQEASSIRNQPLNEISALISGSQVQAPQFSGVSQVGVPSSKLNDNTYNSYAAQVQAANQKSATQNANTSGLYGLAGTAITVAAML